VRERENEYKRLLESLCQVVLGQQNSMFFFRPWTVAAERCGTHPRYIAAPYSAGTEEERVKNVETVIDAAVALFQKGHYPYIPHLTHWVDKHIEKTGIILEWDDYMEWHKTWLVACDALLYLNSSKGADLELQSAKDSGKLIFYSLDEVPANAGGMIYLDSSRE